MTRPDQGPRRRADPFRARHRQPVRQAGGARQVEPRYRCAAKSSASPAARDPRDAQRDRGRHGQLRADVDRRRQRHGGRRRLRAGAGVRRDRPRRRPVVGRVAARGAAARRAARHRRPDPGRRQAPRPPRPRRRLRHPRRGRQGPAGASTGGSSTPSPRAAASTTSSASGPWRGPPRPPGPTDAPGIDARAAGRRGRRRLAALRVTSTVAIDRELGAAHITVHAPGGDEPTTADGLLAAGADAWLARRRPPARRRHPAPALQRAGDRHVGAAHRRRRRRRRSPPRTCCAPTPTTGSSTRSRCCGHARSSASTCRRARSSRSSSRAAASPACSPSWSLAADRSFMLDGPDPDGDVAAGDAPAHRRQRRLVPDVQRAEPAGDAVLGRPDDARRRARPHRQGPARRRGASTPGSSRSRPTTSTGTTRSA